ncbi:MAG: hypothetical protein VX278_22605 [Myxococcota bacterium]|nr:hypothetical protein [Myxococcota bacterium]
MRFFLERITSNPLLLATFYSLAAIGGAFAISFVSDSVRETSLVTAMLRDYANLINMGIVLPIGIILVLNFYNQLQHGFTQLIQDQIIKFSSEKEAQEYLQSVDRAINKRWFFPLALGVSVVVNALILLLQGDTWHAWDAGFQAWWFRFFVIINFYMIANILLRGVATVIQMRRVFESSDGKTVVLQPLHPDGCGGLKELGAISMALNAFLCLLAVYLSVVAFAKGADQTASPSDFPFFIPIIFVFIILSVYLFLAPLSRAHKIMSEEKRRVLAALNAEFQATYSKISESLQTDGISLQDAQKIESIERLYRIGSEMPVWPMDARIIQQLGVATGLPILLGMVTEFINRFILGT